MDSNQQTEEKKFAEDVGIVFEQTGLPRMAGRIFGWLMICDPPYQSPDELAEALIASKGSISSTTRLLIQIGLLERFSMPGVRHDYFRLRANACQCIMKHGLEDEIKLFRQLAERGLALLGNKAPLAHKRLEEMRDVYIFLEREFPALLERWEQERARKNLRVTVKP